MKPLYNPRGRELADLLRSQRKKLGLSVNSIPQRGGPSRPTCVRLEAGEVPARMNVETMDKIDEGYGLDPGTARFILKPDWSFLADLEVILTHLQAAGQTVERLKPDGDDDPAADSWLHANRTLQLLLTARRSDRTLSEAPVAQLESEVLSVEEA